MASIATTAATAQAQAQKHAAGPSEAKATSKHHMLQGKSHQSDSASAARPPLTNISSSTANSKAAAQAMLESRRETRLRHQQEDKPWKRRSASVDFKAAQQSQQGQQQELNQDHIQEDLHEKSLGDSSTEPLNTTTTTGLVAQIVQDSSEEGEDSDNIGDARGDAPRGLVKLPEATVAPQSQSSAQTSDRSQATQKPQKTAIEKIRQDKRKGHAELEPMRNEFRRAISEGGQNWTERQARGFSAWLNSIIAPLSSEAKRLVGASAASDYKASGGTTNSTGVTPRSPWRAVSVSKTSKLAGTGAERLEGLTLLELFEQPAYADSAAYAKALFASSPLVEMAFATLKRATLETCALQFNPAVICDSAPAGKTLAGTHSTLLRKALSEVFVCYDEYWLLFITPLLLEYDLSKLPASERRLIPDILRNGDKLGDLTSSRSQGQQVSAAVKLACDYVLLCGLPTAGVRFAPSDPIHPRNSSALYRFLKLLFLLDFGRAHSLLPWCSTLFKSHAVAAYVDIAKRGTFEDGADLAQLTSPRKGGRGKHIITSAPLLDAIGMRMLGPIGVSPSVMNKNPSMAASSLVAKQQNAGSQGKFSHNIPTSEEIALMCAAPSLSSYLTTTCRIQFTASQSPLDEFNYSTSPDPETLAAQLADGIRLAKLAEILTVRAQRRASMSHPNALENGGGGYGVSHLSSPSRGVARHIAARRRSIELSSTGESQRMLELSLKVPAATYEDRLANVKVALAQLAQGYTLPNQAGDDSGDSLDDLDDEEDAKADESNPKGSRVWSSAFTANTRKDIYLLRTRTAEDIAKGDVEQVLTVLWKIAQRWELPALLSLTDLKQEVRRVKLWAARPFPIYEQVYMIAPELSLLLKWAQTVVEAVAMSSRYVFERMYPDADLLCDDSGEAKADLPVAAQLRPYLPSKSFRAPAAILHRILKSRSVVDNFTSAFADGTVLCLLIHYYYPSLIPVREIRFPLDPALQPGSPKTPQVGHTAGGWRQDFSFKQVLFDDPDREHRRAAAAKNFALINRAVRKLGGVPPMLHPELNVADVLKTPAKRNMFSTPSTSRQHTTMSFMSPAGGSTTVHAGLAMKRVRDTDSLPDEKVVIIFVARLFHRLGHASAAIHATRTLLRAWRRFTLHREINRRIEEKREAARLQALALEEARRQESEREKEEALRKAALAAQARAEALRREQERREAEYEARMRQLELERELALEQEKHERERERSVLPDRDQAIIKIQAWMRGVLARKLAARLRFQRTLEAATVVNAENKDSSIPRESLGGASLWRAKMTAHQEAERSEREQEYKRLLQERARREAEEEAKRRQVAVEEAQRRELERQAFERRRMENSILACSIAAFALQTKSMGIAEQLSLIRMAEKEEAERAQREAEARRAQAALEEEAARQRELLTQAKAQAEQRAREQAQAQARQKQQEQAQREREAEAAKAADEAARLQREREAILKKEAELAKIKAQEEVRVRAEREAALQREAEAARIRAAEEEAKLQAEKEAAARREAEAAKALALAEAAKRQAMEAEIERAKRQAAEAAAALEEARKQAALAHAARAELEAKTRVTSSQNESSDAPMLPAQQLEHHDRNIASILNDLKRQLDEAQHFASEESKLCLQLTTLRTLRLMESRESLEKLVGQVHAEQRALEREREIRRALFELLQAENKLTIDVTKLTQLLGQLNVHGPVSSGAGYSQAFLTQRRTRGALCSIQRWTRGFLARQRIAKDPELHKALKVVRERLTVATRRFRNGATPAFYAVAMEAAQHFLSARRRSEIVQSTTRLLALIKLVPVIALDCERVAISIATNRNVEHVGYPEFQAPSYFIRVIYKLLSSIVHSRDSLHIGGDPQQQESSAVSVTGFVFEMSDKLIQILKILLEKTSLSPVVFSTTRRSSSADAATVLLDALQLLRECPQVYLALVKLCLIGVTLSSEFADDLRCGGGDEALRRGEKVPSAENVYTHEHLGLSSLFALEEIMTKKATSLSTHADVLEMSARSASEKSLRSRAEARAFELCAQATATLIKTLRQTSK